MKNIIFFGTKISWICERGQLNIINDLIKRKVATYITYSNVHVVVTGKKNIELQKAINCAYIASPDGKPLSVVGKLIGAKCMEKCSGPDMMIKIIENGLKYGYKHYFYGSEESTLLKLKENLLKSYPEINIVGMYSPPYRELTPEEDRIIIEDINAVKPDCIWVGLGAPKQEVWMYNHMKSFTNGIMLGVGAAFDFHAQTLKRAPLWMQKCGLEWFYRVVKEPKRLWKRYLVTNTLFLIYLLRYGASIEVDSDLENVYECTDFCNQLP